MRPKSHYRGLTAELAAEIRRLYFAREAKQAELAKRYGRSQGSISRIISGGSWAR